MDKDRLKGSADSRVTAVNFAEMKVSSNPAESLVVFSIGSGIGLTICDPVAGVGGILNLILPDSAAIPWAQAGKFTFMFADTGIPAFLSALNDLGARVARMKVVLAGGAQVLDQTGVFNIGQKNVRAAKDTLLQNKIPIYHEDLGEMHSRKLRLDIGSGNSFVGIADGEVVKI
jgi:chemotaxis protein CheD